MTLGSLMQSLLSPLNYFSITRMALDHNPYILLLILIAFVFFLINAALAINKKSNRASSILKFAPSVLTSLGLLGTFLALTNSLISLGLNDSGNISNTSLSIFIKSLESVFSFSILGIGSAILFMVINFLILASRNGYLTKQKENNRRNIENRQTKIDELNKSTLQELKNQNYHLQSLATISTKADYQNNHLQQINHSIKSQLHLQSHQNDNQQEVINSLNDSIEKMTLAISRIKDGYDMDKLGDVISHKIGELLTKPLSDMTQALEKNNSDVIHQLLADLREDILIPIKDEIETTNKITNKVVDAVNASQDINKSLIEKLSDISGDMDSFVTNTGILVGSMSSTVNTMEDLQRNLNETLITFNNELKVNLDSIKPAIEEGMNTAKKGMTTSINVVTEIMSQTLETGIKEISNTVSKMETLQTNQDKSLENFNNGLKNNLESIKPAIEEGMNTAKEGMVNAIEKVTENMNTAMAGVITRISDDVVDVLGKVLVTFNDNMNEHLTRMNNELQATGQRSSDLIDQSAVALKETLGTIDKTLAESSTKLQVELEAFRQTYQMSLNDFFLQQNNVLEQTLGVQNERLQATANQLGAQFKTMAEAQKELNNDTQETIKKSKTIYEPLLNQMSSIARELNQGHNSLARDLRDVFEHSESINAALEDLGSKLPKAFSEAFEKLNDTYVERFNDSNKVLQNIMQEMISASAVLLTTSKNNNQDD